MKKYKWFILPVVCIALFIGPASALCAGGWPPVPKNPARIFHLRKPSVLHPGLNVTRPVHLSPIRGASLPTPTLPATPAAVPTTSALSNAVQHQAVQAQVSSGLVSAFHTFGEETEFVASERPPVWELMGGNSYSSGGKKMSALQLRIALSEEHALPPNANEWDRDSLQEFYDTYLSLKSGAAVASRFSGKESERRIWARSQPDYLEENYVYDTYTLPFSPQVDKLRVLVINDKREPLEPLLEAAAKDSRVDVTWALSPKSVITKLQSGFYDVVLCDYVMRGGTADMLGMKVYNEKIAVPVVLYSAAGATPDYLLSHNILGRIDIALTAPDAKRVFNYLSNLKAWHQQLQTVASAPQGVSELGYFHLLGNDNAPTLPAWATQTPARTRPSYPAKRTRESLELELTTYGFQAQVLEKMSRDEMEKLLNSYKAFVSAKTVTPRYDFTNGTLMEQLKHLEEWAQTQPDYVEDNYNAYSVADDEFGNYKYSLPFHPAAKSMRILAVRDDEYGVDELTEVVSRLHPEVTIELATSVAEAKSLLAYKHYDVVLTDYVLGEEHNGFEVSMYVWNNKLNIPVVSYSDAPMAPLTLFQYNIVGEVEPAIFPDEAERVLNYLSNIAATGKAYPNGK